MEDMKKQHEAAQKEAAKRGCKGSQETIPEWSNQMYNDIAAMPLRKAYQKSKSIQSSTPSLFSC